MNKGIPVALITTPQFDFLQKTAVDSSGWASEQLDGRLSYRLDLPAVLPKSDLAAITSYNLPATEAPFVDIVCDLPLRCPAIAEPSSPLARL